MKKGLTKFTKILVLTAMIISDLMTPIKVFANEISDREPVKGDIGINNKVTNDGNSATVSVGSIETEGGIKVTKTVSKTNTEGRYQIDFKIEGKDVKTSTEVNKPVYAVVVFDRSGSMASTETETDECARYEKWHGIEYCAEYKTVSDNKWESAVQGAKDFANTLLKKIPTANIALVAFSGNDGRNDSAYNDATVLRNFSSTNLDSTNFGSANGGTNLQAGLYEANKLLNASSIPNDAYKYVVVISDGQPTFYYDDKGYTQGEGDSTNTNTYNATINMANTVKNTTKAEVFSIGYMLPSGNVYGNKTAADILTEVSSPDKAGSTVKHYVDGKPEDVANAFTNIAEEIGTANAGANAVLTDNIGGQFTLTTDTEARSYISEEIPTITEEGTNITFYVDIDKDSTTGWHDTNAGFKLEYTDYKGEKQTLEYSENPQVYWVQNTYDYVVNYYKDSFNNLIKSETRKAPNGTIINESNVDRDKYLPEGYEFNTINPSSITITNDGVAKKINILYTIKKFNYVVNYYYDDVLDSSLTINKTDIPYGTSVDSKEYYLKDNQIREGYTLDTVKSDNKTYTITDNDVVINIYYKKNSYGYSVNYFFNSEKGFTTNDNAIYGDKITAQSKWLNSDKLSELNKSDYFLDPNKSEENNKEITIGTDKDKNVLDIYYINTNFNNTTETISKVTNTEKVTSSSQKVSYKVTYNTSINNVRKGDKVVVTITDTLPGSIIENESTLNGGVYNSTNNTITWTYTYNINEYQKVYRVSKEISYTVKYENYLGFNGNTLVNTANGYTTVSHEGLEDKVTEGKEDTATVPVEIKGTVTATYKTDKGTTLNIDVTTTDLVGKEYTTEEKEFIGYTLKEVPANKEGTYTEEPTTVNYIYTKNDGDITENEVTKIGPDTVNSINSEFNYTITYKGKVENYVGKATLTLTDELPYEATIISKDNRCNFNNNVITCTEEYSVNGTLEINEEFNISVKYTNIDADKVVNKVNSKLALENNTAEDETEKETEVYKGTVVATYKDENGNELHTNVTTTGLSGTEYTTEEKSFYGYTLKQVPTNKEGKYVANQTIYVDYVYTKNIGDVTENEVTKVQNNIITDINSQYNYVLTYSGKVENYVGDVTLELTDTLPYNAEIISKDNKCIVTGKTIVCTDVYTIDETHQVINASFNIVLKYTSVGSEVKNIVNSKLTYGNKTVTDNDEVIDTVPSGKVTATYTTDKGTTLHTDVTTTDLVGKEYTTEQKEFFGYTLKEIPTNKNGTYTKEDITVNYIYTKNTGDIENPDTEKTGPDTINSVDGVFEYNITASGNIKEYVGTVKVTVKDILPYAIDEEKSTLDNRCTYDGNKTITCTQEYINITEEDYANGVYTVDETFNLKLVFIGIDSNKVVNKATSTIELDGTEKTTEDEKETEVYKGTVVATYKDENGNELHENVTTTGLSGTEYTTEQKTFFGYTFKEVTGDSKEGKYLANQTLTVNYVYTKNIGTSEEELNKNGLEVVGSINDAFDYTITYNTEIKDYVGKATLTITDILPYEIDTKKSVISNNCKYNKENNTIVCKYEVDNALSKVEFPGNIENIDIVINEQEIESDRNIVFNIEENFKLYYINVTDKEVTNKVTAELTYGETTKTTDDEYTTEVEESKVIVNYVTKDGTKLTDSITLTGLVGTTYETVKKEFDKYSFIEVRGEVEGAFTKEDKEVTYVYDLTILPPQTGVEMNMFMYINYIFALLGIAVAIKTYKTIKNN